jgi:hypothetical protein
MRDLSIFPNFENVIRRRRGRVRGLPLRFLVYVFLAQTDKRVASPGEFAGNSSRRIARDL